MVLSFKICLCFLPFFFKFFFYLNGKRFGYKIKYTLKVFLLCGQIFLMGVHIEEQLIDNCDSALILFVCFFDWQAADLIPLIFISGQELGDCGDQQGTCGSVQTHHASDQ